MKTFRRHLKCRHLFNKVSNTNCIFKPYVESNFIPTNNDSVEIVDLCDVSVIDTFKDMSDSKIVTFLAKLYNSLLLPRKYIQDIINFVTDFLKSGFISVLQTFISDLQKSFPVQEKGFADIQLMFQHLLDPFNSYETEYLKFKQFEESNTFIKPIEHVIGERQRNL